MRRLHKISISSWAASLLLFGCDRAETPSAFPRKSEYKEYLEAPQTSIEGQEAVTEASNRGDRKSTALELKQRYPDLVLTPDRPHPIGDRLKRELEGLRPDEPSFASKVDSLWRENISRLSSEVLGSASDFDIAKGLKLPKEVVANEPADMWSDTPEAMIGGLAYMAASVPDCLLPDLALQQSNRLPPTKSDIVVFQALNDAVAELGPTMKVSQFEKWEPLGKARNPLFRLLALRAAIRTTSRAASALSSEDPNYTRVDGPAKLNFYLSFLGEADPVILAEAIGAVATVPTPEARRAIENFQVEQQQRGDATLVKRAVEALRTQGLVTQGATSNEPPQGMGRPKPSEE